MRKLAIAFVVAALLVTGSQRRAEADCHGGPCPAWLDVMGWTFAAGVAGGYGYGTGTFIYRDLNDQQQSLNYAMTESSINGLLATIFVAGTIDSARNHNAGATLAFGSFAALHTTLAAHGIWRAYDDRSEFRAPMYSAAWIGGSLYGLNTLYWAGSGRDHHQAGWGITEAAVNAPIAVGLGYLSYDRFTSYRGGPGLAYGGMAVVSSLLVIHGIKTAVHPYQPDKLDLLGSDLVPTIVDDGHESGPGLGLARTW